MNSTGHNCGPEMVESEIQWDEDNLYEVCGSCGEVLKTTLRSSLPQDK